MKTMTRVSVEDLKEKLRQVRKASLDATNRGDYLKVAKLTVEAANLNKAIMQAEGPVFA